MKRGFLFGLGSFLIVGVVAGISEVFRGSTTDEIVGALLIAACAPLSVIAIRKANSSPLNASKLHAIGGWLLGFLIVDGAVLAAVGIGLLINSFSK